MRICSIVFDKDNTLLAEGADVTRPLAFIVTRKEGKFLFNETCSKKPLLYNKENNSFSFGEGLQVYASISVVEDEPIFYERQVELMFSGSERVTVRLYIKPQSYLGYIKSWFS